MNVEQIPTLDEAELAILGPLGTRRNIEVGEYLFREGDTTYDFYVVLSGLVEITVRADGEDRVIITHGAGRFLGELNLLTGSRVFLSARVAEPGEVLAVPLEAFRRVHRHPAAAQRQNPRRFHGSARRAAPGSGRSHPGHRVPLLGAIAPAPRVLDPQPAAS